MKKRFAPLKQSGRVLDHVVAGEKPALSGGGSEELWRIMSVYNVFDRKAGRASRKFLS